MQKRERMYKYFIEDKIVNPQDAEEISGSVTQTGGPRAGIPTGLARWAPVVL